MERLPLKEIAQIEQGVCPNSHEVWLLNLDMVESNTGRIIDYQYVTLNEIGNSTISFDCSNVLYSKLRPYLNKVVLPQKCGYATSEMIPLKPKTDMITREYLTYFLRSKNFVDYINSKTYGAKMPRVNTAELKNALVPCPSLDKQKEITQCLDKLISLMDMEKEQLKDYDNLIKSRFVEMFGDPEQNLLGWDKKHLSEIITYANNGMARRGNDPQGNIVMRLVELQDGYIDYSAPNRIILTDAERQRYLLCDRDFLFARVNGNPEYVGRCAVFHEIGEPVYYNDHIIRVHFDDTIINGVFASALLNSTYGKRQIRGQIKTSAGQFTISQDGIGAIVAILPPIELQNQFAAFVEQVDKLKTMIKKSIDEMQLLFSSLMQKYFE